MASHQWIFILGIILLINNHIDGQNVLVLKDNIQEKHWVIRIDKKIKIKTIESQKIKGHLLEIYGSSILINSKRPVEIDINDIRYFYHNHHKGGKIAGGVICIFPAGILSAYGIATTFTQELDYLSSSILVSMSIPFYTGMYYGLMHKKKFDVQTRYELIIFNPNHDVFDILPEKSTDDQALRTSISIFNNYFGDTLIDPRDGQIYQTITIGKQRWMAQNLNVGKVINGYDFGYHPTNNGIIEKFCYGNKISNCEIFGGLYEWSEAMQYKAKEGSQGICPRGWHIPTDHEWKILEGTMDSLYAADDREWNKNDWRGTDAGCTLREADSLHWNPSNMRATNESGFTGLPGGYRDSGKMRFDGLGEDGYFWSSSKVFIHSARYRRLSHNRADIYRNDKYKRNGLSVRCIKDE